MSQIQEDRKFIGRAFMIALSWIVLLWLIELMFFLSGADRGDWGVMPRILRGLPGILTMPLVHGGWEHLISNSGPLLILSMSLIYLYRSISLQVLVFSWITPGLWVWAMAVQDWRGGEVVSHIGASGVVFALAFFLFFSGIIRNEVRSLALALIVAFLYGGMIWGVLPLKEGVSWEGHLFGAITGIILAIYFRKKGPQKPDRWEEETENPSDRFGPWNYKELFPPPEGFNYPEK